MADTDPPTRLRRGGQVGSILKDETWQMEDQRRNVEKNGHRQWGIKVHDREHREPQQMAPEEGYHYRVKQHPWLDNPLYDGIADNESPNPFANPEAEIDFENAKREQEYQHRLKLGLQPTSAPEYKPS